MTEKQKSLIDWIWEMTGVRYQAGESLSDYIVKNRPKAEEAAWLEQLEHEAAMDELDARRDW